MSPPRLGVHQSPGRGPRRPTEVVITTPASLAEPGTAAVWLRAVVVGVAGVLSAIASHALGGGLLPGLPTLAVLTAVASLVAAQFLGAWTSPTRLVALMIGAQSVGHLALSMTAGHAGDSAGGGVAAGTAQGVPAQQVVATAEPGQNLFDVYLDTVPTAPSGGHDLAGLVSHQISHAVEAGPAMMLAHLLGAALLGLFLARGEAALSGLVELGLARAAHAVSRLRCAVRPLAVLVAHRRAPRAFVRARLLALGRGALDPDVRPLRGPPLLSMS